MKKDYGLININKNPFNKIFNFFRNIIIKRKIEKGKVAKKNKQKKIYVVEYDTDPKNTNYGDIYLEDRIIRNSPYVKSVQNQIEYAKRPYTKEEKEKILKKYQDFLNDDIKLEELSLDEIIVIDKLLKEE